MSEHTTIEWCDVSLSPWWGCTRWSPGCLHCYMMVLLARWKGGKHCGKGEPRLRIESFRKNALRHNRRALELGKRLTVFPSMCDPLDAEVPIEWFVDFLEVIRLTPALTWLFLTKRPELWQKRLSAAYDFAKAHDCHDLQEWCVQWLSGKPPANIWMMASVEDQTRADERVPALLKIPAAKRGLSIEPLIGPVKLSQIQPDYTSDGKSPTWPPKGTVPDFGEVALSHKDWPDDWQYWAYQAAGIHWVIVGGESGHGHRPMKREWITQLRDQCKLGNIPFFFKQWGGRTPKAGGRLLDGVEHNGVPG